MCVKSYTLFDCVSNSSQVIGAVVLTIMGVVFHFLQEDNPLAMFSSFAHWLREFNERFAEWSGISKQWIVKAEIGGLFFFGLGMMQIGEYAIAVGCWVILAFIGVSKALDWDGVPGRDGRAIAMLLKLGLVILVVVACVFLITITNLRRDDEPWSNLQKLWGMKPHFSMRVTTLATNGALPVWALDTRASREGYFCRVPIMAEVYLTNTQTHAAMLTDLHVEAMDVNGQWEKVSIINSDFASPIYVGSDLKNVRQIEATDGKYLDQQIVGKNIGPGETKSGWLFLTQELNRDIRGPLKFSLSDLQGIVYVVGPVNTTSSVGLPVGAVHTMSAIKDLTPLTQETCPLLGWE
jgi:hypothetical protein